MFHQTNFTASTGDIATDRELIARLIGEGCSTATLKKDGSEAFIGLHEYDSSDKKDMITMRKIQRVDDLIAPFLKDELKEGFSYWLITDSTLGVSYDSSDDYKVPRFVPVGKDCGVNITLFCFKTTVSKAAMKTIRDCVETNYNNLQHFEYPRLDILYENDDYVLSEHPDMFNFIPLRYCIPALQDWSYTDLCATGWCSHTINPDSAADSVIYHCINDAVCYSTIEISCNMEVVECVILDAPEGYFNLSRQECDASDEDSLISCHNDHIRCYDDNVRNVLDLEFFGDKRSMSFEDLTKFVDLR